MSKNIQNTNDRAYLAKLCWTLRKESRQLKKLTIPASYAKYAKLQGITIRK